MHLARLNMQADALENFIAFDGSMKAVDD